MSPLLVVALACFFVLLLSQFGSRLAARNPLIWWLAARVREPTSGFRVYSAQAVRALLSIALDEYPEPVSIALLAVRGSRIAEVPVRMGPRTTGRSTLAGFSSIRYMIKVTSALAGLRLRSLLGG